jgi:hypothetical protein
MLPEDVQARFRQIEDNLRATAELQRQREVRAREDIGRLKAIQDAMARWMDKRAARRRQHGLRRQEEHPD